MAGLSLLNDIVFKMVFGTEANRPLLRALLNALLGLVGDQRIANLEILNPQLDRDHLMQKGAILDIKARDGRGRLYNIEVQLAEEPAYVERALYYLARLFTSQLEKGEPYTRVAKTIGISLVDFVQFRDLEDLHTTFRLHDRERGLELTDVFELHFIELPKFQRNKPRELRSAFEKWLHVLKFGELYEGRLGALPEELRQEEGIEMAVDEMRKLSASEQVRWMIEDRMKAVRDEATRLERANQKGLERGRQEGLEEGLSRGMEKGMEKGEEQGRRAALLETARKMRDEGVDDETIRRVTGVDPETLDE